MNASVLELNVSLHSGAPVIREPRSKVERWIGLAVMGMLLALGLSFAATPISQAFAGFYSESKPVISIDLTQIARIEALTIDDKAQIVVEGASAVVQNAEIPFSGQPLERAQAFGIAGANAETYGTALKCLTQAVYYEAANEPVGGRRAVAQVVLNRVRHPAYPNSVCGVVYQGSQRRTGCQFSFTCDGALLRAPALGLWNEARQIAEAALGGLTEPSVGTATHYHADYVLPKWAFELGKVSQIGRHIFYRFGGSMGNARAFSDRYSGLEQIPALNFAVLRERALSEGMLPGEGGEAPQLFTPGLTVTPDITDRHAASDVGGRVDMTKVWRPSLPDPVSSGSRFKQVVAATSSTGSAGAAAETSTSIAVGDPVANEIKQ